MRERRAERGAARGSGGRGERQGDRKAEVGAERLGLDPSNGETEKGAVSCRLGRCPVGAATTHECAGGGGGVGGAAGKGLGRYPVGASTTHATGRTIEAKMGHDNKDV